MKIIVHVIMIVVIGRGVMSCYEKLLSHKEKLIREGLF